MSKWFLVPAWQWRRGLECVVLSSPSDSSVVLFRAFKGSCHRWLHHCYAWPPRRRQKRKLFEQHKVLVSLSKMSFTGEDEFEFFRNDSELLLNDIILPKSLAFDHGTTNILSSESFPFTVSSHWPLSTDHSLSAPPPFYIPCPFNSL